VADVCAARKLNDRLSFTTDDLKSTTAAPEGACYWQVLRRIIFPDFDETVAKATQYGFGFCFLHSFWNFRVTMRFYALHRKLPRIISEIVAASFVLR